MNKAIKTILRHLSSAKNNSGVNISEINLKLSNGIRIDFFGHEITELEKISLIDIFELILEGELVKNGKNNQ